MDCFFATSFAASRIISSASSFICTGVQRKLMKVELVVPDDFDVPLPDEMQVAFEER